MSGLLTKPVAWITRIWGEEALPVAGPFPANDDEQIEEVLEGIMIEDCPNGKLPEDLRYVILKRDSKDNFEVEDWGAEYLQSILNDVFEQGEEGEEVIDADPPPDPAYTHG